MDSSDDKCKCPAVVLVTDKSRTLLGAASGDHFVVWAIGGSRVLYAYEFDPHLPDHLIRCMAFSHTSPGEAPLVATAGDDKILRIWDTNPSAKELGTCIATPKRLTTVAFDKDNHVVYADRFGDVFRVKLPLPTPITEESLKPVPEAEKKKKKKTGIEPPPRAAMTPETSCILGHCSMLTAMTLSPDESLVVTGDRDEHVRVSQYPESYNIVSFCLGHLSSVFGTVFCSTDNSLLCTGSGDGTLRLWRVQDGAELACEHPSKENTIAVPCDYFVETSTLAAMVEGENRVFLYTVDAASSTMKLTKVIEAPSTVLSVVFDALGGVFVGTTFSGIQYYDNSGTIREGFFDDSPINYCTRDEAKKLADQYAYSLSKRFVYSRDGERPKKRPHPSDGDDGGGDD